MRRMLLHECLFVGLIITGIIIAIVLVSISQVITPNDVASLSRHPTLVIILSNPSLALPPLPGGGVGGGAPRPACGPTAAHGSRLGYCQGAVGCVFKDAGCSCSQHPPHVVVVFDDNDDDERPARSTLVGCPSV